MRLVELYTARRRAHGRAHAGARRHRGHAGHHRVRAGDETRVLILTTFDLDEYAFSALRAGASGFLLKDVPPAELVAAIRTVARGDAVVSPADHPAPARGVRRPAARPLRGRRRRRHGGPAAENAALASLTEREREVLLAVADGLSNAEIAERLYVSEATVKSHVGRLLAKLGLRDRVQAVVFAFQSGLVRPSEPSMPVGGRRSRAAEARP